MAKREKLSRRILNAYRALRGDPWPITFIEGPKITYHRPPVVPVRAECCIPLEAVDLVGRASLALDAQQKIAAEIGRTLLDTGAIEFHDHLEFAHDRMRCTGKIWVLMPGEEGGGNG